MSVAPVLHLEDNSWRTPGCSEQCRTFYVRFSGRYYNESIICHDAGAHEAYGEHALTRLYVPLQGQTIRTGGITVCGTLAAVLVHGEIAPLTPTELRIMFYLARHLGRVCHASELIRAIWGTEYLATDGRRRINGDSTNTHLVRVNMARLRPKLGTERRLLLTHTGMGYRLLAEQPTDRTP